LDSETFAISLVESPAIESNFIALSKEEEEKQQVFLESNEKHLVVGAALIPDKDIYRNNGKQEFYINFSKESIEKMSQDFMKEYRQYEVNTDHDKIADEVCVVESWLVSDSYRDKSSVLGMTVPEGTWMVSLKVNNIETWDRIKAGELKGFSVESMISLEEFSKNDNNMEINTNEEMFFDKIKNVFKEVLATVTMSKVEEEVKPEPIEPIAMEDLEAQTPTETVTETPTEPAPQEPQEAPKAEEVVETPTEPKEEVVEPQNEPTEAPKVEDKHLEDLINSLKEEIAALKEMNNGLNDKVKELSKEPSAKPISTNAKPSGGNGDNLDSFLSWRNKVVK
jgi:hypothetical protein